MGGKLRRGPAIRRVCVPLGEGKTPGLTSESTAGAGGGRGEGRGLGSCEYRESREGKGKLSGHRLHVSLQVRPRPWIRGSGPARRQGGFSSEAGAHGTALAAVLQGGSPSSGSRGTEGASSPRLLLTARRPCCARSGLTPSDNAHEQGTTGKQAYSPTAAAQCFFVQTKLQMDDYRREGVWKGGVRKTNGQQLSCPWARTEARPGRDREDGGLGPICFLIYFAQPTPQESCICNWSLYESQQEKPEGPTVWFRHFPHVMGDAPGTWRAQTPQLHTETQAPSKPSQQLGVLECLQVMSAKREGRQEWPLAELVWPAWNGNPVVSMTDGGNETFALLSFCFLKSHFPNSLFSSSQYEAHFK